MSIVSHLVNCEIVSVYVFTYGLWRQSHVEVYHKGATGNHNHTVKNTTVIFIFI